MRTSMRQRLQTAVVNHRQNIQKSLEHRLAVARAKGDDKLIAQIEAEKNYYN